METENKLLWRRHIDHLKKLEAKPTCVSEMPETRVSETPETDDPDDEVIVTSPSIRSNSPDTGDDLPDSAPPPL